MDDDLAPDYGLEDLAGALDDDEDTFNDDTFGGAGRNSLERWFGKRIWIKGRTETQPCGNCSCACGRQSISGDREERRRAVCTQLQLFQHPLHGIGDQLLGKAPTLAGLQYRPAKQSACGWHCEKTADSC